MAKVTIELQGAKIERTVEHGQVDAWNATQAVVQAIKALDSLDLMADLPSALVMEGLIEGAAGVFDVNKLVNKVQGK
jgi:hypothetical protein